MKKYKIVDIIPDSKCSEDVYDSKNKLVLTKNIPFRVKDQEFLLNLGIETVYTEGKWIEPENKDDIQKPFYVSGKTLENLDNLLFEDEKKVSTKKSKTHQVRTQKSDKLYSILKKSNTDQKKKLIKKIETKPKLEYIPALAKLLDKESGKTELFLKNTIYRISLNYFIENYESMKEQQKKYLALCIQQFSDNNFYTDMAKYMRENRQTKKCVIPLEIIQRFQNNRSAPIFIKKYLHNSNPYIRATAVTALSELCDNYYSAIKNMLNDNDDRVVANVVEAIGKTKNPEYIKKMHRFLKHKNNRVLGNSIKYLWPYYKDKCKTKINEIIKKYGKDTKFYKSIIWALNEIKNKK